eukprot:3495387-Alexandrium_andersonii.AAC.1
MVDVALKGVGDRIPTARSVRAAFHNGSSKEQRVTDHRMGASDGGPGGAGLAADLHRHLLGFDDVLRFALFGSRLLEARH